MIRLVQRALVYGRRAPWEYMPEKWRTIDARIKGWNVPSIVETQTKKWLAYVESLKGTRPLGINHEAAVNTNSTDIQAHNTLIVYAYVLALAAQQKRRITLLDWGGGMGHYYVLSKVVLPRVEIDYYCQDLPLLCQAGREVLPQVHFWDEQNACFGQQYDLVLASSSLWYVEDWRSVVSKLVACTREYLYLTRMLFVGKVPSFVVVQRPWAVGYRTEYLCWVFNREEVVNYVVALGMELVREFILSEGPHIHRAPEQGDFRGFLFRKAQPAGGRA